MVDPTPASGTLPHGTTATPRNLLSPADPVGHVGIGRHLQFVALSLLALMLLHTLLRGALFVYNRELAASTSLLALGEAFANGLRFDLRLAAILCAPLLLALLHPRAMAARRIARAWLVGTASLTLLFGIVELDFYREFNQRLNGLVFQYIKEDPKTVLSMLWYGFPVLRHLIAWALATALLVWTFRRIDALARSRVPVRSARWPLRVAVLLLCLPLATLAIRGTLRQGPPLRWGDAFTTESLFANQLGLNGTLSLAAAAQSQLSDHRDNAWQGRLPEAEALQQTRAMLLTSHDALVTPDAAAVRRDYRADAGGALPVRNVVVILMESFAGVHVGALGARGDITPHFDRLAQEGLLFTRFYSNGTHTHQGMFASIGCFPNLPAFEYLMQTPEAANGFSGLPQLLGARGFDNLYVYNGDFAWDNQSGFFGRQGVTNFISRFDFKNPVVFDPTWGVSDQDMFDRAAAELAARPRGQPFYAILQTLSNHTPYPIPATLPVERVTGNGSFDEHLTAMRYSDWALGRFFEKIRREPFFDETLFVILGDHGFPSGEQLTDMNLSRFNVPLLLIAPGITKRFGERRDTVGSQVDVVPTIMGRLGGTTRHQCWGRDLLALPQQDRGFAVIKPSGSDQTVAIIEDDRILVDARDNAPKQYRFRMGAQPEAIPQPIDASGEQMRRRLDAYLQTATKSLLGNTTGVE